MKKLAYLAATCTLVAGCNPELAEICQNRESEFSQSMAVVIVQDHVKEFAKFPETVKFRDAKAAPINYNSNDTVCNFIVSGEIIAQNAYGVPQTHAFLNTVRFTKGGEAYEIN